MFGGKEKKLYGLISIFLIFLYIVFVYFLIKVCFYFHTSKKKKKFYFIANYIFKFIQQFIFILTSEKKNYN